MYQYGCQKIISPHPIITFSLCVSQIRLFIICRKSVSFLFFSFLFSSFSFSSLSVAQHLGRFPLSTALNSRSVALCTTLKKLKTFESDVILVCRPANRRKRIEEKPNFFSVRGESIRSRQPGPAIIQFDVHSICRFLLLSRLIAYSLYNDPSLLTCLFFQRHFSYTTQFYFVFVPHRARSVLMAI